MIRQPKTWRLKAGFSLALVAIEAGIGGRNPSRTYDRYERGINVCPAAVIETVRRLSKGAVTAEAWQRVRLAFLEQRSTAGRRAA